jgi:hypothetical protein
MTATGRVVMRQAVAPRTSLPEPEPRPDRSFYANAAAAIVISAKSGADGP